MSTTNTEFIGTAVGTARATHSRRGFNRISTTFLVVKPLRSPRRYMGANGSSWRYSILSSYSLLPLELLRWGSGTSLSTISAASLQRKAVKIKMFLSSKVVVFGRARTRGIYFCSHVLENHIRYIHRYIATSGSTALVSLAYLSGLGELS